MFEHLPLITNDSLEVVLEHELGYFGDMLRHCEDDTPELDTTTILACTEFESTNPNLAKAIQACSFVISSTLLENGVSRYTAWQAGVLSIPMVLYVLRLVDRGIESEKMQNIFG